MIATVRAISKALIAGDQDDHAADSPTAAAGGGGGGSAGGGGRHEIKMICGGESLGRVMTELRLLGCGLRTLHPERLVQSVYFDTPRGRAFEENDSGASEREKLRLRWYGPQAIGVQARLERKIRKNQFGWKDVLNIAEPLDIRGVSKHALLRRLIALTGGRWREALTDDVEAVQWIRYVRQYFTTADQTVRFTVDRNLRTFDQRTRLILSDRCPSIVPSIIVVECKADRERYDDIRAALESMPLVIDKCSKFVLATDPHAGPIVSVMPV